MLDVFRPTDLGTVSLAVTSSTGSVRLPENSGRRDVRIYNSGSVDVFVRFGGSTVTAATTDMPIPAGAVETFSLDNSKDGQSMYMAGITASGTATLYVTHGQGF